MSPRTAARLLGAIRLVSDVDTIGVPVFVALRGNEMFVPEMDSDFRISAFIEFFNEDGFQIVYDLPSEFSNQRCAIGAPTPMPFWISNKCYVINGDADKEEPVKMFGAGALRNPVLADLSRLLDDARSGRIAEREKEWTSQKIANSFADVFYETPVRSRYWITRYRVAVANARRIAKPPHPIDTKLREVAGEWFRRFGTKTDLRKLCGMLGSSANEIFSKRQMTDIIFAFLINEFSEANHVEMETYLKEKSLHSLFPLGLYNHYIEHGWPRVPFRYKKPRDFTERMLQELWEGREREDFRRAANVCFLLYGRGRAPGQIETLAGTYLKQLMKEFKLLDDQAKEVFKFRQFKQDWVTYADALLEYYEQMLDLDGIVNPTERLQRTPFDRRFGVRVEYLNELRKIRDGRW